MKRILNKIFKKKEEISLAKHLNRNYLLKIKERKNKWKNY